MVNEAATLVHHTQYELTGTIVCMCVCVCLNLQALRDNATKIVSMVVSMPLSPSKWAGLAFSGDGQMPNSSALIATLSSSGAPVIDQYSLNDRSQSAVIKGGKKIVFAGGSPEGYYDQGTTVYMSFQVDFAKSTAQPNFLLMAFGNLYRDGTPDYHAENRAFFSASFVSGAYSFALSIQFNSHFSWT